MAKKDVNVANVANIPIVPKVNSKISFEEIEKYGNQWQNLKQTRIYDTMTEFCIWYCGQHGGTPSSVREIAEKIFKVTSPAGGEQKSLGQGQGEDLNNITLNGTTYAVEMGL